MLTRDLFNEYYITAETTYIGVIGKEEFEGYFMKYIYNKIL